jgi:hypothetical protein
MAKKAFNATKACIDTAKHLADTGEILVSKEEYEDRVKTCQECPLYEKFATDECGDCLCYVKTAKAWLASQYCPQYKWEGDDMKITHQEED